MQLETFSIVSFCLHKLLLLSCESSCVKDANFVGEVGYFKFWEKNVENQISFKAKNTGKGP